MPDFIAKLLQILPPLRGPKDPGVASVVGFLTGGIGLGIYFRSFIDVLVPVVPGRVSGEPYAESGEPYAEEVVLAARASASWR
jgi:hypothetical protein